MPVRRTQIVPVHSNNNNTAAAPPSGLAVDPRSPPRSGSAPVIGSGSAFTAVASNTTQQQQQQQSASPADAQFGQSTTSSPISPLDRAGGPRVGRDTLLAEAMSQLGQVPVGASPRAAGEHLASFENRFGGGDDDDDRSTRTTSPVSDAGSPPHDATLAAAGSMTEQQIVAAIAAGNSAELGAAGQGSKGADVDGSSADAAAGSAGGAGSSSAAAAAAAQHAGNRRATFRKTSAAIMASLRVSKHLWDSSASAKQLSRGDVSNPLVVLHQSLHTLLWNVPHVNVLRAEELQSLQVMIREYGVGDVVMDRGMEIQHVYALISGTVEVYDNRNFRGIEKRVGSINAPNLFAMDGIVFDAPSQFAMRAGDKCVMVLIPRKDFLRCIHSNRQFAHSLTTPIVEHMGLFGVFQDFCRAVFTTATDVAAASDGTVLNLTAIIAAYRKLDNVIHPLVNDPEIDVGGWLYACRRLPDNVAESLVINLARALPAFLAQDLRTHVEEGSTTGGTTAAGSSLPAGAAAASQTTVKFIPTHDRRRCTWQIGDKGHTFVLLRESYTDVLDFITCMCIHITESQKLRRRLRSMTGVRAIDVLHHATGRIKSLDRNAADFAVEAGKITDEALGQLKLSDVEVQGLKRIWPTSCLSTIYEIFLHREEYMITLDSGTLGRFDVDPYVRWALSLRRHLLMQLGLTEVDELPADVTIDIISSNTHGTKNCLCTTIRKHAHDIEEWGAQKMAAVSALPWFNRQDFLFYAFAKLVSEDAKLRAEYREQLVSDGFTIIEDSAMTGLQVDIVELSKLNENAVDTELQPAARAFKKAYTESAKPQRCFLINMDFAFGAQADYITHALILAFGRAIRSFNVMGKAGALVGARGDIQLPTSIIFSKSALGEDSTDENRGCGNEDLLPQRLRDLSGRDVHVGPVLTIPGTLLQNEKLLRFYRTVIGCVGLEMEGTYFARQLEEAIETGLLSPFVRRRFAYYTSDLPLRTQSASLSKPMTPNEGIPSMYGIYRAMLERIFSDCSDRQKGVSEEEMAVASRTGSTPVQHRSPSLASVPAAQQPPVMPVASLDRAASSGSAAGSRLASNVPSPKR